MPSTTATPTTTTCDPKKNGSISFDPKIKKWVIQINCKEVPFNKNYIDTALDKLLQLQTKHELSLENYASNVSYVNDYFQKQAKFFKTTNISSWPLDKQDTYKSYYANMIQAKKTADENLKKVQEQNDIVMRYIDQFLEGDVEYKKQLEEEQRQFNLQMRNLKIPKALESEGPVDIFLQKLREEAEKSKNIKINAPALQLKK